MTKLHSQSPQRSPQLAKFLRRAYNSRKDVLEYNHNTRSLSCWNWPNDPATGERMTPKVLYAFALSNEGSNPYCLCPLTAFDLELNPDPQALIALAGNGLHAGEHIIRCATNQCGYTVPLERIYNNGYFPRSFLARDSHDTSINILSNVRPGLDTTHRGRRLKRTYAAVLDTPDIPKTCPSQQPFTLRHSTFAITRKQPPIHPPTSDTDFLTRLSSWTEPGLYENEFRELMSRMVQCSCGMVMAQDVFDEHRCKLSPLRPFKRPRYQ